MFHAWYKSLNSPQYDLQSNGTKNDSLGSVGLCNSMAKLGQKLQSNVNYNFPFSLFVELHAGNPHSKNARLNMLMGVYVVGPDYCDADPFMLLDGTVPLNTTVRLFQI